MSIDIERILSARSDGGRLRSRKNTVHAVVLDGQTYVVKVFEGADADERAARESTVLRGCAAKGIPVPSLLAVRGPVVVMSFIEGKDAMTILDEGSTDASVLLYGIAAWLCRFHDSFGRNTVRGDCILKNFMVTASGIAGMDFEESSTSDPIGDMGQLCASLLSSRPMFTPEKFALARGFRDEYSRMSGTDLSGALPVNTARALEYYAQFRRDGPEMVAWAGKLRREGF